MKPKDRLKALNTVPMDLDAAYDDVMDRIKGSSGGAKELALEVLSWIFRARRLLRMGELLEALVVEDGDEDLDRDCMLQPSQVIDCCKSLVVYDKSTELVRFVHYTVQEYIARKVHQELPPATKLALTCLTYLSFQTFSKLEFRSISVSYYQFGKYAAQFWGSHTRGEAERLPQVQQSVVRLLRSETTRRAMSYSLP